MTKEEIISEMRAILESLASETEKSMIEFEMQRPALPLDKQKEGDIAMPILADFAKYLRAWRK